MLAFKPLFQNNFPGSMHGFHRHGMDSYKGMTKPVETLSSSDANDHIQATLTQAYLKIQSSVQSRFPATQEATGTPEVTPSADDYSPQAVADRVVGFIADRLAQAQADGASQEDIQNLYQQALKGVEQGLREGRDIIQNQGLFNGNTKDTYYQTVNKIADGLTQLGENLFGADLDGSDTAAGANGATDTQAPAVNGTSDAGSTNVPSSNVSGFQASNTQVQIERNRSFEMEVLTQEGDKVKILVNSGQSFASNQVSYADGNTAIDGFEASFSSFDNLSFSVEGDLNQNELAALNDLFSQVNDVAATFYGGDVEQAFNQAMDVGMNPEQLASFAVNINQSESVAVRDTYVAVQNMAGPARANPYQDTFNTLGQFARKARHGAHALSDSAQSPANMRSLYADLIGRMHSDNGRHKGHGDAFQRFANRLAG